MSVSIGRGAGAAGGTGVYTQAEKLALELELSYKNAQQTFFCEYIYTGGNLTQVNCWETASKLVKIFQNDYTYSAGIFPQLMQQNIMRISDNVGLRKVYAYGTGFFPDLVSVTRTII